MLQPPQHIVLIFVEIVNWIVKRFKFLKSSLFAHGVPVARTLDAFV